MENFLLAYIDPGVGSIVFQALAAGVLGLVVTFKSIRMRIVSIFRRKNKDES
jgi:hypothetical protein